MSDDRACCSERHNATEERRKGPADPKYGPERTQGYLIG
jgi:hypothetical protein